MDVLHSFLTWAFERHHNILSWYIRPLFLLPFCFFAYKKSVVGIIITLLALLTSMFWFPKPAAINPKVEGFLAMEWDYLMGEWTFMKLLASSLVPLSMYALAFAFWRHSWKVGILVINLIALLKVLWSVYASGGSGTAVILPAFIGLAVCNAAVWLAYRFVKKKAG